MRVVSHCFLGSGFVMIGLGRFLKMIFLVISAITSYSVVPPAAAAVGCGSIPISHSTPSSLEAVLDFFLSTAKGLSSVKIFPVSKYVQRSGLGYLDRQSEDHQCACYWTELDLVSLTVPGAPPFPTHGRQWACAQIAEPSRCLLDLLQHPSILYML